MVLSFQYGVVSNAKTNFLSLYGYSTQVLKHTRDPLIFFLRKKNYRKDCKTTEKVSISRKSEKNLPKKNQQKNLNILLCEN